MSARAVTHALTSSVQVRINPGIARIEPDLEVAVFTPCRRCRLDRLLRGMSLEEFAGRSQVEIFLLFSGLANEEFKKPWSFEPPVAKQFGVEWDDNDWIKTRFADLDNLPAPLLKKVRSMRFCRFFRCLAIIQFFFLAAPGDAIIFHAGKFSASACDRAQMLHRKIEADVAIKFTVGRITGITFVRTPDLPARLAVARENGWSGRCVIRRVNRSARRRSPKHDAVCIQNEPANVRLL